MLEVPRDLKRLQADFAEKFAERPTYAYVVGDILRRIDEEVWADEQGVPRETVIELNRRLTPALEALLNESDPARIHASVDALVRIWWQVLPRIKLA